MEFLWMCSWYTVHLAESPFVFLCLIPLVMPRLIPRTAGSRSYCLYNTILFDTLSAVVMLGELSLTIPCPSNTGPESVV